MKISSMSGVTLPEIFMILQDRVPILAVKLHAYPTKVSLLSKRPLKFSLKVLTKLRVEVEKH